MKLLDVPLARAIWIFDLGRVNAAGRSLLNVLLAIGARYRFAKFPQHLLDVNKDNALEFNSGTFVKDGIDFRVGLTIYNNGVSGDSISSTETSDAFLDDLTNWLAVEHNLNIKAELKRKAYLSQVHFQAKATLPLWNPKLEFLNKAVSSNVTTIDGKPRDYELNGISVWSEDTNAPGAPAAFRVERKWGTNPSDSIYFSQAPMATQTQLVLLEKLEKELLTESKGPAVN